MGEVRDHYRVPYPDNYGSNTYPKPALPVVYDNLQPEGEFAKTSEMKKQYNDLHPQRPVIHRLRDHSAEVQPEGRMESNNLNQYLLTSTYDKDFTY